MSDLRPTSPLRRPQTAHPRADPTPEVAPPSADEAAAIQRQLVALPAWEGATVTPDPELGVTFVRGPGGGPDTCYAALPRWGSDDWPQRLRAVEERQRAEGTWPSLLWCDRLDQPPGLDLAIEGHGWLRVLGEEVRWVGHATVVPHLDPGLRIEAVQPPRLSLHETLERRIFGIDDDQAQRRRAGLTAALEAGSLRAWIVWLGDEPVAVARLSRGEGMAAIQGVGVVPERRRQGLGTLLTTVATRAGLALGHRLVWLSVRPEDEVAGRVYERLGYRRLFGWSRYLVTEDPRPRP